MNKLIKHIKELSRNQERFIISIDGRAASGKSTLADFLEKELNAVVFHMDDYFLPEEMKTKERLSVFGGNVHYERLQEEVLNHLDEESVAFQKYNCNSCMLEPSIYKKLSKYIVIEGVYSQQEILRKYYNFNIFTTITEEVQHQRLKKRNPKLFDRFITEWLPLEEEYFTNQDIEILSDYQIIVEK